MDFERNEGKTLTCVATPQENVVIDADVEAEEGITMHPVEDFQGVVSGLEECARETKRITIDLDHDISFNAAVQVVVPGDDDIRRSWSIASPPSSTSADRPGHHTGRVGAAHARVAEELRATNPMLDSKQLDLRRRGTYHLSVWSVTGCC